MAIVSFTNNEQSLREKELEKQVVQLRAESRNADENAGIMREALQVTTDLQFKSVQVSIC